MIRSMFSGVAGLKTHQQKMDVIGNNIANVNTGAYKSARTTFKESIYQTVNGSSNGTINYGGSNPTQIGYGSKLGTVDFDYGTGNYEPTGKGTDCMIDGGGFFLVGPKIEDDVNNAAADGSTAGDLTQLKLTRMGNFMLDGDGFLCDGEGNVVYGFYQEGTPDAYVGNGTPNFDTGVLMPIRLQKADGTYDDNLESKDARLNLNQIRIDDKGNLIGISGESSGDTIKEGDVITVARLAIANVPNPNALEKTQGPYYKAVQNTGLVRAFEPGTGSTGLIMASGLEMANVDLAKEFSDMITTQRGFQANSKIITVSDEMLQELVNLKR